MTDKEKLISMLQPKDYKSKIKRYCNLTKFCVIVSGNSSNFVKTKAF